MVATRRGAHSVPEDDTNIESQPIQKKSIRKASSTKQTSSRNTQAAESPSQKSSSVRLTRKTASQKPKLQQHATQPSASDREDGAASRTTTGSNTLTRKQSATASKKTGAGKDESRTNAERPLKKQRTVSRTNTLTRQQSAVASRKNEAAQEEVVPDVEEATTTQRTSSRTNTLTRQRSAVASQKLEAEQEKPETSAKQVLNKQKNVPRTDTLPRRQGQTVRKNMEQQEPTHAPAPETASGSIPRKKAPTVTQQRRVSSRISAIPSETAAESETATHDNEEAMEMTDMEEPVEEHEEQQDSNLTKQRKLRNTLPPTTRAVDETKSRANNKTTKTVKIKSPDVGKEVKNDGSIPVSQAQKVEPARNISQPLATKKVVPSSRKPTATTSLGKRKAVDKQEPVLGERRVSKRLKAADGDAPELSSESKPVKASKSVVHAQRTPPRSKKSASPSKRKTESPLSDLTSAPTTPSDLEMPDLDDVVEENAEDSDAEQEEVDESSSNVMEYNLADSEDELAGPKTPMRRSAAPLRRSNKSPMLKMGKQRRLRSETVVSQAQQEDTQDSVTVQADEPETMSTLRETQSEHQASLDTLTQEVQAESEDRRASENETNLPEAGNGMSWQNDFEDPFVSQAQSTSIPTKAREDSNPFRLSVMSTSEQLFGLPVELDDPNETILNDDNSHHSSPSSNNSVIITRRERSPPEEQMKDEENADDDDFDDDYPRMSMTAKTPRPQIIDWNNVEHDEDDAVAEDVGIMSDVLSSPTKREIEKAVREEVEDDETMEFSAFVAMPTVDGEDDLAVTGEGESSTTDHQEPGHFEAEVLSESRTLETDIVRSSEAEIDVVVDSPAPPELVLHEDGDIDSPAPPGLALEEQELILNASAQPELVPQENEELLDAPAHPASVVQEDRVILNSLVQPESVVQEDEVILNPFVQPEIVLQEDERPDVDHQQHGVVVGDEVFELASLAQQIQTEGIVPAVAVPNFEADAKDDAYLTPPPVEASTEQVVDILPIIAGNADDIVEDLARPDQSVDDHETATVEESNTSYLTSTNEARTASVKEVELLAEIVDHDRTVQAELEKADSRNDQALPSIVSPSEQVPASREQPSTNAQGPAIGESVPHYMQSTISFRRKSMPSAAHLYTPIKSGIRPKTSNGADLAHTDESSHEPWWLRARSQSRASTLATTPAVSPAKPTRTFAPFAVSTPRQQISHAAAVQSARAVAQKYKQELRSTHIKQDYPRTVGGPTRFKRLGETPIKDSPVRRLLPMTSTPRSRTPLKSITSSVAFPAMTPHPAIPLRGVVAIVEVYTLEGSCASSQFVTALGRLGAKTTKIWSDRVTHVIFKDGSPTVLQKIASHNKRVAETGIGNTIHCVGSRWISDCDTAGTRLDETDETYAVDTNFIPASNKRKRKSMEPATIVNIGGSLKKDRKSSWGRSTSGLFSSGSGSPSRESSLGALTAQATRNGEKENDDSSASPATPTWLRAPGELTPTTAPVKKVRRLEPVGFDRFKARRRTLMNHF